MDFDEHIDPLDPRFVDAVLARARRRAAEPTDEAPSATPDATAPQTATPQAAAPQAPAPNPAAETAPTQPVTPAAQAPAAQAPPAHTPAADPSASSSVFSAPASATATTTEATADTTATVDGQLDPDDGDDDDHEGRRTRNLVEWVAVAVGAVVVAFLIRAFLLQAFYIPSESMEPTLYENDRILVNKLSYKLHDVNRGDLLVFEKPANEPANGINDLIKRAIALSGETIELRQDGMILIDGELLNEPYLAEGQPPGQMSMARANFVEGACINPMEETTRCTIGDGFVWVMGDNRDHSHDSRAFGPVDEDLIVGRAFVKIWPLSDIGFL